MRKLSLQEIKAVTVGALSIEKTNEGYRFYKCTKKQIAAWYDFELDLGKRSETTTGVRLDFYTNSTVFAFRVKKQGRYDVYIDNIFKYSFNEYDFDYTTEKKISLDGRKHRITLYLPSHSIGILDCFKLDDDAYIEPTVFERKILFLGDSITQGWDSKYDSLSYAQIISRYFKADSVVQGIGGAIYLPSTFDSDINFEPDIVIVSYGTNDWNYHKDIKQARKLCSEFLDCVTEKYGDKKIFAISPIFRGDQNIEKYIGTFESCISYIEKEIKKHNIILIEGKKLTPHLSDFFCDDYLHPNIIGHSVLAQNLIFEIQKKLKCTECGL